MLSKRKDTALHRSIHVHTLYEYLMVNPGPQPSGSKHGQCGLAMHTQLVSQSYEWLMVVCDEPVDSIPVCKKNRTRPTFTKDCITSGRYGCQWKYIYQLGMQYVTSSSLLSASQHYCQQGSALHGDSCYVLSPMQSGKLGQECPEDSMPVQWDNSTEWMSIISQLLLMDLKKNVPKISLKYDRMFPEHTKIWTKCTKMCLEYA